MQGLDEGRDGDIRRWAKFRELAGSAALLMETHRVTALLVTDDAKHLLGALNVHDLMRAGVV